MFVEPTELDPWTHFPIQSRFKFQIRKVIIGVFGFNEMGWLKINHTIEVFPSTSNVWNR
jgi:hypothetical protein